MKKLRLSYSLLKAYSETESEKSVERLVNTYLHLNNYSSKAMSEGTEFDAYTRDFVNQTGMLPPELGGEILGDKATSGSVGVVPYSDKFDLSYEFDIVVPPHRIIEVKRSVANDSGHFLETGQVSFYFLVATLLGMDIRQIDVYRYDPINKTFDKSTAWLSEKRLDEARNMVQDKGEKIYKVLKREGVL